MELHAVMRTSRHSVTGQNLLRSVTIAKLHFKIGPFVHHRCVRILSSIGASKAPNSKNHISFHRTFILDLSPIRSTRRPGTIRVRNAVSPRGFSYRYRLPHLERCSAVDAGTWSGSERPRAPEVFGHSGVEG